MTRDGVLRQNYLYRGVRHDSEIWSVLAPEWRGPRPGAEPRSLRGSHPGPPSVRHMNTTKTTETAKTTAAERPRGEAPTTTSTKGTDRRRRRRRGEPDEAATGDDRRPREADDDGRADDRSPTPPPRRRRASARAPRPSSPPASASSRSPAPGPARVAAERETLIGQIKTAARRAPSAQQISEVYGDAWHTTALVNGIFALLALLVGVVVLVRPALRRPATRPQPAWIKCGRLAGVALGVLGLLLSALMYFDLFARAAGASPPRAEA